VEGQGEGLFTGWRKGDVFFGSAETHAMRLYLMRQYVLGGGAQKKSGTRDY